MQRRLFANLITLPRPLLLGVIVGLLIVFCENTLDACPTCKDNLAGDPTAQGLARGFYYSILFMISMPFIILGSLCSYFYFLVRQAEWQKQRLVSSTATTNATASS
jgi:hypothetical protein